MTFRAFVAGVLLAVVVAGGARRAHAADADATVQVLDARGRPLAGAVLVRPAAERGALVLTGGEEEIARANAEPSPGSVPAPSSSSSTRERSSASCRMARM